jgi:dTMP kinase
MSAAAWEGRKPDLVLVVDIDPAIGLSRKAGSVERDRFDEEADVFQRRVRSGYLSAAERLGGRALVLNGELPADSLLEVAWREILVQLEARAE